jgi:carboxyl-terminal processing protease
VGTTTFGKAAVQTPYTLSNGGEIWLPTAHYFTPNGSDIHIVGITPDITVEATDSVVDKDENMTVSEADLNFENDLQLQEAIKIIIDNVKGEI